MADLKFKVSVDGQSIDSFVRDLGALPKDVESALAPAINKTAMTGRARIADAVTERTNIKRGSVLEVLKLQRATKANPVATIAFSDKPRPAFDFKGLSVGKKGISVEFYKGKGRRRYKHAFVATVASAAQRAQGVGHKGVFQREKGRDRKNRLTKKGYARRLPIDELKGPSVVATFQEAPQVAQGIVNNLGDELQKNLLAQIDYRMKKRLGK